MSRTIFVSQKKTLVSRKITLVFCITQKDICTPKKNRIPSQSRTVSDVQLWTVTRSPLLPREGCSQFQSEASPGHKDSTNTDVTNSLGAALGLHPLQTSVSVEIQFTSPGTDSACSGHSFPSVVPLRCRREKASVARLCCSVQRSSSPLAGTPSVLE